MDTVKRKLIKLVRSSTTSTDRVKTRMNHRKKYCSYYKKEEILYIYIYIYKE